MNSKTTFRYLLLLLATLSNGLQARETDAGKVINIEAGNVIIDEKKGTAIYSGDVRITQGSRQLSGVTMTLYSQQNKLSKIIITGSPARFSQQNDKDETIQAEGGKITFDKASETLILEQEAVLQQQDNIFRSHRIAYNTAKDTIIAGDLNNPGNERVKITIQPENNTPAPTQQNPSNP